MDRWLLPGPLHFLNTISDALREGLNVVLATPSTGSSQPLRALEKFLGAEGWHLAGPVCGRSDSPLDQLFAELSLEDGGATRRSIALLRDALAPGQVVQVHGVGLAAWPAWRKLLEEYEVASRGSSAFDRSLLLVVTEGIPVAQLPRRAAALKAIVWDGVIGELDMLLYATEAFRKRSLPMDKGTRLLSRLIAQLSLWDFEIADYLINQHPRQLFQPAEALRSAKALVGSQHQLGPTWEEGGRQQFDGIESMHPYLVLNLDDPMDELRMRVWAAQAAEILPALELHRRALSKRMRPAVSLPMQLGELRVTDLDDLEIGQLAYVANARKLGKDIRRLAEKWRKVRNKLAHLEALDADEALDEELLGTSIRHFS
jgi:hypothetical protein